MSGAMVLRQSGVSRRASVGVLLVLAFALALFAVSLFSGLAHADAVTTAAASAAGLFTSDGQMSIGSVGSAIVGLAGVAVLFKWIKGMFFS